MHPCTGMRKFYRVVDRVNHKVEAKGSGWISAVFLHIHGSWNAALSCYLLLVHLPWNCLREAVGAEAKQGIPLGFWVFFWFFSPIFSSSFVWRIAVCERRGGISNQNMQRVSRAFLGFCVVTTEPIQSAYCNFISDLLLQLAVLACSWIIYLLYRCEYLH